MVCDCFLTEEEIERGELGCGEDCLNRLLMIEWYIIYHINVLFHIIYHINYHINIFKLNIKY